MVSDPLRGYVVICNMNGLRKTSNLRRTKVKASNVHTVQNGERNSKATTPIENKVDDGGGLIASVLSRL